MRCTKKSTDYDLSKTSDLDLLVLRKKARQAPEDRAVLHAILQELGKRARRKFKQT